jgi:hypothetical protein
MGKSIDTHSKQAQAQSIPQNSNIETIEKMLASQQHIDVFLSIIFQ